ncbi:Receptor-type guanylate cyclase gcy-8 [Eumeta japonica]|uniref:Receptor-type guanylate cyclase gcy-8 n=1 Tax=Eumeta variegata TaxID=151549 RepID=A0A4C2A7Z2_EUMVA|nr:Receptor-type guanylate cyclase gcy-8 [Eumeta japonica]
MKLATKALQWRKIRRQEREGRVGCVVPAHCITHKKFRAAVSYPSCSGALAPGLAADMHFKDEVIAFIGPACAFALEPVARLAAYWNTPIITGMGDQVGTEKSYPFN